MKIFRNVLEGLFGLVALALVCVFLSITFSRVTDIPAWVQAVGSVAAIVAAVWIMKNDHKETRRRETDAQRDRTRYILSAIKSEIDLYIQPLSEMTSERFSSWPTMEISFPIYEACAGDIGTIADDYLRHRVIAAYAEIRSLIWGINNYSAIILAARREGMNQYATEEHAVWTELYRLGRETPRSLAEVCKLLTQAVEKLSGQRSLS
jgi:hypothetical protein